MKNAYYGKCAHAYHEAKQMILRKYFAHIHIVTFYGFALKY